MTKVFDDLMQKRLNHFLFINNLLCDHQFGFKSGLSTMDALAEFTNSIYNSNNKKEKFVIIYLDFSKTLDTESFYILWEKLSFMGFKNNVNDWFRSFLSLREYFVAIGEGVLTAYESRRGNNLIFVVIIIILFVVIT